MARLVQHMEVNKISIPEGFDAIVEDNIARRCPPVLVKEAEV